MSENSVSRKVLLLCIASCLVFGRLVVLNVSVVASYSQRLNINAIDIANYMRMCK